MEKIGADFLTQQARWFHIPAASPGNGLSRNRLAFGYLLHIQSDTVIL
jgi:hypothetical protein